MTKRCSKCKTEFNLDQFHKDRSRRDGLTSYCKECTSARKKAYILSPEQRQRKRHQDSFSPSHRYHSYKWAAFYRGLPFEISFEEFKSFWQKPCFYCGRAIEAVGIDRYQNNIGYFIDNLVPCCTRCNRMKRDMDGDAFLALLKNIVDRHPQNDRPTL
jgi:hypothetical protein